MKIFPKFELYFLKNSAFFFSFLHYFLALEGPIFLIGSLKPYNNDKLILELPVNCFFNQEWVLKIKKAEKHCLKPRPTYFEVHIKVC